MQILAESAVRITVLALGVAVVLRVLRIRSPGLVHAAWTAVVVVMLLLPAAVAWGPEVAVPLLPSHSANAILDPLPGPGALEESRTAVAAAAASPDVAPARLSWRAAAGAVYFAGVGLLLLRLGLGIRWGRVLRGSAVLSHGRLMHPACVTPMTIGLFAPAVVLPSDWASWSEDELAAVLAHEEAHVRRRDPLVAALALLNRAIFWFHPLAWWLQHEVGRRAEQACDDAVIARGHDRECYSSCLVQFARRASGAGGRIVPVAMAMPGAGLRERLALLAAPPARLPGSRLACAAVAYGVLVGMCTAAVPIAAAPRQSLPPATGQRLVVHASEHFDIVHGGLAADRLTETAREAEAAYAQLSAAFKYDLPRRVTVILVPRDGDRLDGRRPHVRPSCRAARCGDSAS